ncbi:MAG: hypothetical protein ACI9K2_006768 [Myxococcota bacterium]
MKLSPERAGPYARALRAALNALAPNEDHVPLREADRHLAAVDPAVSGDLVGPAEVDPSTGMPAFAWLERVVAEAAAAERSDPPSLAQVRHAESLDAALGARMRSRRQLHLLLAEGPVLPLTRLVVALKWEGEGAVWSLSYDRLAPAGYWVRIRAELAGGRRSAGPLGLTKDGVATVDETLQHLLTRQFETRLTDLYDVLRECTEAEPVRLSRGWLGPFWFPGAVLPTGVPAALGEGLLLHAAVEVLSRDVATSAHLDPWRSAPKERLPPGYGVFRERRFAAKGRAYIAAREWAERAGFRNIVVPIGAQGRRL